MAPKKRKEVEDPSNTWNMQLMAAALRFDVAEAERLIDKGASPASAREATPFAPEDTLSPLAAVLLQGDVGPAAVAMMRFLIENGASLNERMPLPRDATESPAALGGVLAGVSMPKSGVHANTAGAGGAVTAAAASASASAATTAPAGAAAGLAVKKGGAASPSAGDGGLLGSATSKRASMANSSAGSPLSATAGAGAAAAASASPADVEEGTVLHYLVAVGDHVHLLQLLLLAGVRRDGLRTKSPAHDEDAGHDGEAVHWLPSHDTAERERSTSTSQAHSARNKAGKAAGAAAHGDSPPPATQSIVTANSNNKCDQDAAATTSAAAAAEQEPITVLPHTLCLEIAREYNAHKHAVLEAAAATTTTAAAAPDGTSLARAGATGSASNPRDRSRSRATSLRAASPPAPVRHRLPLLSAMPAPTDRQRLLLPVPGGSGSQGLREAVFDFHVRTSRSDLTPAALALERGDLLATRLLLFYGAALDHNAPVNGTQTALARACATGQVELVELLLDAGAPLSQLSQDGRYTLIHYAVGQPAVLECLIRRGLSMEAENAHGDSALVSLIRFGTGRNSTFAVRETTNLDDVQKLVSLPHAALRNYILMPLPPPTHQAGGGAGGGAGAGGAGGKRGGGSVSGRGGRGVSFAAASSGADKSHTGTSVSRRGTSNANGVAGSGDGLDAASALLQMGGGEMGTWWSFTPLSTAALIGNVLEAGANFHGYVPDEELGLAFVRFAEEELARKAAEREVAEAAAAAEKREEAASRHARLGKKRTSMTSSTGPRGSRAAQLASPLGPTTDTYGDDLAGSVNGGSASASLTRSSLRPCGVTAQEVPARLPLRLTPLMHAIVNYHPELIAKFVLEYKVDLTRRDSLGATALHYACAMVPQQNVSVLKLLLDVLVKEGASGSGGGGGVAGGAGIGSTAMAAGPGGGNSASNTSAGRRRSMNPTASPDAAPFDLNAIDMAGLTALHYAAACGNEAAVALLLSTPGVAVGLPDHAGRTALHWAVEANAAPVVERLIRHTATVAEAALGNGSDGFLASLGMATSNSFAGSSSSRSASRGRAASPSGASASLSFSQQRRGSASSSVSATASGVPFGMAVSPHATVDVEAEERETNATALELALKGDRRRPCDPAIIHALLREGNANFYRPSGLPHGGTLLHRTVVDGNVGCVQALLDQYADPNEVDDEDQTPLFLALQALAKLNGCVTESDASEEDEEDDGDDDANVAVTAQGAGEQQTVEGEAMRTSARAAKRAQARAERLAIVDALLRAGAYVFAQSMDSLDTPLHLAATTGDLDVLGRIFYEPTAADTLGSGGNGSMTSAVYQRRASRRESTASSARPSPEAGDDDGSQLPTSAASSLTGRVGLGERARQQLLSRRGHKETAVPAANTNNSTNNNNNNTTDPSSSSSAPASASSPLGAAQARRAAAAVHVLIPLERWLACNARDETPLHLLCAREGASAQAAAVPILEKLLRPDESADAVDDEKELLRERLLGQMDHQGRTALHVACRTHFVEAVVLLLAARPAGVFAVDARGWTPLHDAVAFCGDVLSPQRMEAVIEALATTVTVLLNASSSSTTTASLHLDWTGMPAPAPSFSCASASASLTDQLHEQKRRERQWLFMRTDALDLSSGARRGVVTSTTVHDVAEGRRQYANRVDEKGRSALLLAGDVGNTAAAKAVLRLFS